VIDIFFHQAVGDMFMIIMISPTITEVEMKQAPQDI
jgi:hypothetical protein